MSERASRNTFEKVRIVQNGKDHVFVNWSITHLQLS